MPAPATSPCSSARHATPCRRASLAGATRRRCPPTSSPSCRRTRSSSTSATPIGAQFQEARVVGKEKALDTYEQIVRGRIDPALLEYAGGNTFSGRVFPIPAKGYNRVLIAYEELLPVSGEQMMYRYPAAGLQAAGTAVLALCQYRSECKNVAFKPEDATKDDGGSQVAFSKTWTEKGPGGDVLFACTPANPRVQSISARAGSGDGPVYVYARVRPELKAAGRARSSPIMPSSCWTRR